MGRCGLSGVYMFRNKENGKVYIGESKNLNSRYVEYMCDVRNNCINARPIIVALRSRGFDGFEYTILEANLDDTKLRKDREKHYIDLYDATNPDCGYNVMRGVKKGSKLKSKRKGFSPSAETRIKLATQLIVVDITTDSATLLISGAKALCDRLGVNRSAVTRAIKLGSLIAERYAVFYADRDMRGDYFGNVKAKKAEIAEKADNGPAIAQHRALRDSYKTYKHAYEIAEEFATEWGLN